MRELHDYVYDSENPLKNLDLAMWYHRRNHSASAITFYLRCAERTDDDTLAYACLIQCFRLFNDQGDRQITALNCINRAIALLPTRPEAYYFLSRHYEEKQHWQTAYINATIGLEIANHDLPDLTMTIGYPGKYGLLFQKSVAAWWWGRRDESRDITKELYHNYYDLMDGNHKTALMNNIKNLNVNLDSFDWGLTAENEWFRDTVEKEIYDMNVYEKFREIKEGDVVLDIGASVGPFAYSIRDKNPSKIVCVEPHKKLFPTLEKNTSDIPSVICVNKAIGQIDGVEQQFGLFNEKFVDTEEIKNLQDVETISWKTLLKDNQIDFVDFMKIDCEGGEYSIFTEDNVDWIEENVRYITGEWHLHNEDFKNKFRSFRDTYLTRLKDFKIYSFDEVDITETVWEEWFIERYYTINVYINNPRAIRKTDLLVTTNAKKEHWRITDWPTLEITTNIAKKGCVVDCVFCPQRVLEKSYTDDKRFMTLDEFKFMIDKVPSEVRITFAGFTEPWLNKNCTDMLLYAHEKGHPISVFTTGVGMKPEDVERLADIPYAGMPNGGFTLHLPDKERLAKHPVNENYIKVIEKFKELEHRIQNFYTMSMAPEIHEDIAHIYSEAVVPAFWNRAGNLIGEAMMKPELYEVEDRVMSAPISDDPRTCGCIEDLYHNILLPNGDVSLCCMDYSLEFILGNLKYQNYDDIMPEPDTTFDLCRKCENGVEPRSASA